jgi:hypothetical protein
MHRVSLRCGWLVLLALCGCGSASNRFDVSGTITYRGQPLPAGLVMFDPDIAAGHDGPQGFAHIKDGRFDTRLLGGQPVIAGPHRVRIQGFDGQPGHELPLGKMLFPDYELALPLQPGQPPLTIDVPAKR